MIAIEKRVLFYEASSFLWFFNILFSNIKKHIVREINVNAQEIG